MKNRRVADVEMCRKILRIEARQSKMTVIYRLVTPFRRSQS